MKSLLIFSACLVLILLFGWMAETDVRGFDVATDSQLVMNDFKRSCFASSLIFKYYESKVTNQQNMTISFSMWSITRSNSPNLNRLFYIPQIVGWATWIGISYRPQRPYRNPLRRFRLNKKQRRRLRQHLSGLLTAENEPSSNSLSSNMELGGRPQKSCDNQLSALSA